MFSNKFTIVALFPSLVLIFEQGAMQAGFKSCDYLLKGQVFLLFYLAFLSEYLTKGFLW